MSLAPHGHVEAAHPDKTQLQTFRVQIKRGSVVRCSFEAMGPDSMTVAEQHEGMCERGEYVRVFKEPKP
jgi:hypothetical protein